MLSTDIASARMTALAERLGEAGDPRWVALATGLVARVQDYAYRAECPNGDLLYVGWGPLLTYIGCPEGLRGAWISALLETGWIEALRIDDQRQTIWPTGWHQTPMREVHRRLARQQARFLNGAAPRLTGSGLTVPEQQRAAQYYRERPASVVIGESRLVQAEFFFGHPRVPDKTGLDKTNPPLPPLGGSGGATEIFAAGSSISTETAGGREKARPGSNAGNPADGGPGTTALGSGSARSSGSRQALAEPVAHSGSLAEPVAPRERVPLGSGTATAAASGRDTTKKRQESGAPATPAELACASTLPTSGSNAAAVADGGRSVEVLASAVAEFYRRWGNLVRDQRGVEIVRPPGLHGKDAQVVEALAERFGAAIVCAAIAKLPERLAAERQWDRRRLCGCRLTLESICLGLDREQKRRQAQAPAARTPELSPEDFARNKAQVEEFLRRRKP